MEEEEQQEAQSDKENSCYLAALTLCCVVVRRCVACGDVHGDATTSNIRVIYMVREICCPCEKRGRKHGEMLVEIHV